MEQDIRKRSSTTNNNNNNNSFFITKVPILNNNSISQLVESPQETRRLTAHEHKSTRMIRLALLAATLAILTLLLINSVGAQSTKGGGGGGGQVTGSPYAGGRASSSSLVTAPSPVAQLRQQQNYGPTVAAAAAQPSRQSSTGGTKRRPQQQSTYTPVTQQQQQTGGYQQQQQQPETATEDPLADSEPALYGSVAGQPGVDFPAYTRIPKTSFTCEGKGFDFGFYADEEAQCQVYHVCWSGRRESFLCGVGTVFNQAILACDYWHSVDCSKTSQFYGVNSELGKSNSEPASGSQRQPARNAATLPPSSAATSGANYGDNISQNKRNQQQYNINDDSNFDLPQQQQQQLTSEIPQSPVQVGSYRASPPPQQQQQQQQQLQLTGYGGTSAQSVPTFAPQRSQPQSYEYQQRLVHTNEPGRTKSAANQTPRQQPAVSPPPPPPAPSQQQVATKQRPRFNMDFNQKVNSLIESPIRAPLKSPVSAAAANYAASKQQRAQQQQQQVGRNQQPANFAQLAVSRAQQAGSQQLNLGPARKGGYQQQQVSYQQQQQQQAPDSDIDEPQQQQQQQQQNFDDSPVQTSTVQTTPATYGGPSSRALSSGGFVPQQTVIQAGNGLDGATAITTQYDTLTPAGVQAQSPSGNQQTGGGSSSSDQSPSYESSLEEANSSANDDFRSAGAKAAASHNQNWYIMKSI